MTPHWTFIYPNIHFQHIHRYYNAANTYIYFTSPEFLPFNHTFHHLQTRLIITKQPKSHITSCFSTTVSVTSPGKCLQCVRLAGNVSGQITASSAASSVSTARVTQPGMCSPVGRVLRAEPCSGHASNGSQHTATRAPPRQHHAVKEVRGRGGGREERPTRECVGQARPLFGQVD